MKQNPCPVPGCQRNISITSKFGVCAVHNEIFVAITYYLMRAQQEANVARKGGVRPGERVLPGGFILPPGV